MSVVSPKSHYRRQKRAPLSQPKKKTPKKQLNNEIKSREFEMTKPPHQLTINLVSGSDDRNGPTANYPFNNSSLDKGNNIFMKGTDRAGRTSTVTHSTNNRSNLDRSKLNEDFQQSGVQPLTTNETDKDLNDNPSSLSRVMQH